MVVKKYSLKIGAWKSIKNVAIVAGVPALLWIVNNWTEVVPEEYWNIAAPVIGFVAYLVKNYIQNK